MHFVHTDLNLLRALDSLLEEESVGGAAARMRLSQPAMSRALLRIRRATGDAILVRSGRAMIPTPYALAVRDQVHSLVEEIEAVLSPEREVRLNDLKRTFTLRCHDAITNLLAPLLTGAVSQRAPHVQLRFLAESGAEEGGLRSGHTDLEIGSEPGPTADLSSTVINRGRLAVVMRPRHSLAGRPLDSESFARADHVIVSRRGRLSDRLDSILGEQGLSRRVIASAPTTTAALYITKATDALVVLPESACAADITALGMVTSALPFDVPEVPVVMNWHARHTNDPAHRWLRGLVVELLGENPSHYLD